MNDIDSLLSTANWVRRRGVMEGSYNAQAIAEQLEAAHAEIMRLRKVLKTVREGLEASGGFERTIEAIDEVLGTE